ncbi:MAG: hypothetical protein ACJ74J_19070 [Blastocatellia bacterium]
MPADQINHSLSTTERQQRTTTASPTQFPVFLFAPIGGAAADRRNRHRIMVGTQTMSMLLAFALAGLTLSGHIQVWEVFALAAQSLIIAQEMAAGHPPQEVTGNSLANLSASAES